MSNTDNGQDLKKEKISRILTMKSIRKKNMSTYEKQLSGIPRILNIFGLSLII